MDKPYASYFVSIQGDDKTLAKAEQYLRDTDIVPDYLGEPDKSEGNLSYEVPEGCIPRWDDVDEVFARMSTAFPSLFIEVCENCEEPVFPNRTITFAAGETTERHGRILEPGESDPWTVAKLAVALQENGMEDAAKFVVGLRLS